MSIHQQRKFKSKKINQQQKLENTEDTERYVDVELNADTIISLVVKVMYKFMDQAVIKTKISQKHHQRRNLPIEISDHDNGKTSRKRKLPNAEEIETYKIIVTVAVDSNKLTLPVPEGEQDPNFKYCPMCGKTFIRQRHLEHHVDETCPYLIRKDKIPMPILQQNIFSA